MQRPRLAPLRTAVLLAVTFVALRVVYRVVFGGAGGAGILIIDFPRIRLGGPFEHITMLGPVTSGGVATAALGAVPFAALLLGFGMLAAVVDIRALLARGAVRGPVRSFSRALVVAWSTFPALLESVRRIRVAREFRGERGAASLIVPVLEQTIERAVALGASMEVRGFAATHRSEPNCEHPVVMRAVALGYEDRWTLTGVDLVLGPGILVLVTGHTGSGKSTVLHAMSGLFQHVSEGVQRGAIEVGGVDRLLVPPRETAGFVGVVSQSVRLSFVAASVADELGFTLATRGVAPGIVSARIGDIAARLGIEHLLDRDVLALSAGEACLVAIGAALVEHPVLLIVDEPLADLDENARARVVGVLGALAHEAGVCVVVAEHAISDWGVLPDVRLELREGTLHRVGEPVARAPIPVAAPAFPAAGESIAEVRGISVRHGERLAVDGVSLTLVPGEIVALRGHNGAGKSSLLHAVARPNDAGTVFVDGADVHRLRRRERRRAVAIVPEAFDDLLFSMTVAEECRRADRRAHVVGTATLLARLLGADASLAALLRRHPRDLSVGERLCLVLAIQLSERPRVLLVDEPSRGLDASARQLVGRVLTEVAASGTAVVMATHDRDFAACYASRTLTMVAGRLEVSAEVPS
ncbi:MAG: ATP-binding cassette domain-containing protein [Salinibacterium sp.]|nr:ATP-binding cassette domain-containing protein [Salinibacterium sp.]